MENKCKNCNKPLEGRSDKKYCDNYCKSAYQYKNEKENQSNFYLKVDKQLKQNRQILKSYNKAGKATIRAEDLLNTGFNPNFFTHYWKNQKGDVYLFVYEFGFLKRTEGDKEKYVLVTWQDYMK
ncbi:MAG: hypothetical protein RLZZ195_97 [Pseudomonadota bacterium]|jgi:hypothetical protein